jgi:hypothetical protein
MSTPDSPGRHGIRPPSDPWWPQDDKSTDDPTSRDVHHDDGGSRYDDVRDDRDSPYYRGLRNLGDDRDAPYDDTTYDRDSLYDEPSPSRAIRHVLSAILCLALTPVGIAAMTYGADRYWQLTLEPAGADRDPRGLVALGVGAGLLLIVACLGALSAVGPVLSGVIWGLVPAGLYLVYPSDTAREVADLPALPDFALSGTATWLSYAVFLMAGVLLVGAGLAAAMSRPRRT